MMAIIASVVVGLVFCIASLDALDFIILSKKTKQFRIIKVAGKFHLQRKFLKIYGGFWLYYKGSTIYHFSDVDSSINYSLTTPLGFDKKQIPLNLINSYLKDKRHSPKKKRLEVVYETGRSLYMADKNIFLVSQMIKAEQDGNVEEAQRILTQIIELNVERKN